MREPPYKLLYAGLAFGALAQVLVVWLVGRLGSGYAATGNVAAAVICLGAIWLIRQRQKGRL